MDIRIPVCSTEVDKVALKFNEMVLSGNLDKSSFFYKNIAEVISHLENPSQKWDQEICEALLTIEYHGGRSSANLVTGPLGFGLGRGYSNKPTLNYGGPSTYALRKYRPGRTPISGIVKQLLLSAQTLHPKVSSVCVTTNLSVLCGTTLQIDGTMCRAGLVFDDHIEQVIGLDIPLTFKDLEEMDFKVKGEFLKEHLVQEVDVIYLSSLDGKVQFAIGYLLQAGTGKTGKALLKQYSEVVRLSSVCEACVKSSPSHLNTIKNTVIKKCNSFCEICWNTKVVCKTCKNLGRKTIYPQLEACFLCLQNGITCVKNTVFVVALDCYSGNRYLIEEIKSQRAKNQLDPYLWFTEFIGEIVHLLKTLKSSFSNWMLLGLEGSLINLVLLRTLRDDNSNTEVARLLRGVLKKQSVVNKDRQDTDVLIELRDAVPVLEAISVIDPHVVHQVVPERFRFEPTNKAGSIGRVVGIQPAQIGFVLILSEGEKDGQEFHLLKLHNPGQLSLIKKIDQKTSCLVASEGVFLYSTIEGLHHHELQKGTVIPKIPTSKKNLQQMCSEFSLSNEGNVNDLKKRLKQEMKNCTQEVTARSSSLSAVLKDSPLVCSYSKEDSKITSVIMAGNTPRVICKVSLNYKKGKIAAKSDCMVPFHPDIEGATALQCFNIEQASHILYMNTEKIVVLNSTLETMAVIELEIAITDLCQIEDRVILIQENQLFEVQANHLILGKFSPQLFAGSSAKVSLKNGSSLSSTFSKPQTLCAYKNTVFVGDKNGVKLISKVVDISSFCRNTFMAACNGFGLHKKKQGEDSENMATFKTCSESLQTVNQFLESLDSNVRKSFQRNLPKKLNGPEHTVSSVTKGTVKLGIDSYEVLVNTVETFDNLRKEYSPSVICNITPDSTNTKGVEHFHSLQHRKIAMAQTVYEYQIFFPKIVRESLKTLVNWSFKPFTTQKSSYYLTPDVSSSISLSELPLVPHLEGSNNLDADQKKQLTDFCKEHR